MTKIQAISLSHFRNFHTQTFHFDECLTVIVGENAKGKTNLLESVYFIVMGTGFRESREDELVTFKQTNATVKARIENGLQELQFAIYLQAKGELIEKIYTVQNTKQRLFQYKKDTGFVVLFSPEQIRLINGPPDERREYVNTVISLFDTEYKKKLLNYENALRKRNKLLQTQNNLETLKKELLFWNQYLEEQAMYIVKKRKEYVAFLNKNDSVDSRSFSVEYRINKLTTDRLEERLEEERRCKKTLIGPQKDEFIFYQKEKNDRKNLHHYGSRSEQRLVVLWLKLNEIRKLEEWYGQKPILLLDDIFSELDTKNKHLVLHVIKEYQTIMTTTEEELINEIQIQKEVVKL